jgi:hypothetical protein
LGLRPKLGAPHPWSPPTLGCPVSYIFSSRRLRNLSLIYLLALATTEQPPSCRRRVIRTPPSSDIKIARLRFLFVLRLRAGIDLGDQADIAPARSVIIGIWFSDCIGASSLARRSRIVRVNNHQIGFISTHRKIGHSPSISFLRGGRSPSRDPPPLSLACGWSPSANGSLPIDWRRLQGFRVEDPSGTRKGGSNRPSEWAGPAGLGRLPWAHLGPVRSPLRSRGSS